MMNSFARASDALSGAFVLLLAIAASAQPTSNNLLFAPAPAPSISSAQAPAQSQGHGGPLGVHGSGSTTVAKCITQVMSKFDEQIKLPAKFTYRAVGSGTGMKEFLGKGDVNDGAGNSFAPHNDFAAADIPISREDKEAWNAEGIEFVQLPFALRAYSFFHSVPGVDEELNLSACLLARIFGAEITAWDHPDILALNPDLKVEQGLPIYVGRRKIGSSSTYSITHYLHAQCPEHWPIDRVGSMIEWHASTHICDGSGLMASCLLENEGAIGYVDSASGYENGLTEVRIRNGDGRYLTAKEAGVEGVQAAAMDSSNVPDSADGDFSEVSFFNKPGPNTWPITRASYVFVRKDLSFIPNPSSRSLLKAFVSALYDFDYVDPCARYGLVPVPNDLRTLSLEGLETVSPDEDVGREWTFETWSTVPFVGQGDYVISSKRQSHASYEAGRLADEVERLGAELAGTRARMDSELAGMRSQIQSLLELVGQGGRDDNAVDDSEGPAVTAAKSAAEPAGGIVATASSGTVPDSTTTLATQPAALGATEPADAFPDDADDVPEEELLLASPAFFRSNSIMAARTAAAGWMLSDFL